MSTLFLYSENDDNQKTDSSISKKVMRSEVFKNVTPLLIIHGDEDRKQLNIKFNVDLSSTASAASQKASKNPEKKFPEEDRTYSKEKTKEKSIEIAQKQEGDKSHNTKYEVKNLLRAFKFGMDPFENCIKGEESEENEEGEEENEGEFEVEYVSLKDKVKELFGVDLGE